MSVKYYDKEKKQWTIFPGTMGTPGKDAYKIAQEAGYTGTYDEYMAMLKKVTKVTNKVEANNSNMVTSGGVWNYIHDLDHLQVKIVDELPNWDDELGNDVVNTLYLVKKTDLEADYDGPDQYTTWVTDKANNRFEQIEPDLSKYALKTDIKEYVLPLATSSVRGGIKANGMGWFTPSPIYNTVTLHTYLDSQEQLVCKCSWSDFSWFLKEGGVAKGYYKMELYNDAEDAKYCLAGMSNPYELNIQAGGTTLKYDGKGEVNPNNKNERIGQTINLDLIYSPLVMIAENAGDPGVYTKLDQVDSITLDANNLTAEKPDAVVVIPGNVSVVVNSNDQIIYQAAAGFSDIKDQTYNDATKCICLKYIGLSADGKKQVLVNGTIYYTL